MDIEDKLHRKNTKLAKEEEDKKKEESDRFMKYLDIICDICIFLFPIIVMLWAWLSGSIK